MMKPVAALKLSITISWLTGKILIISDYQIACRGLLDSRKLFKDEPVLNIHYFKSLYQIYNDQQTVKYHVLPIPLKAYQKACIKR